MRVMVCELDGNRDDLESQWDRLVVATTAASPGLVVLPEMPFATWVTASPEVDPEAWQRAVAEHEHWIARLHELRAEVVVTTRPVIESGWRYNEAIVHVAGAGIVGARRKTFLPDEPGFHEATWYERGPVAFAPVPTPLGLVGVMVCTELWFPEHARALGQAGIGLLAVPRATPVETVERWEAAARVAAVSSGAYVLSTNRAGGSGDATFRSGSVIVDPEGVVLARTTAAATIASAEIDLDVAAAAKATYPRYVDTSI